MASLRLLARVPAFVVTATMAIFLSASATAFAGEPPRRVSLQAQVNGRYVTVGGDGTLAPRATAVGAAQLFDVFDLDNGAVAVRAVLNGRYLTARGSSPLRADATTIAPAQMLRPLGGGRGGVRFRAIAARQAVCAAQAGAGPLTAGGDCPHAWQVLLLADQLRGASFGLTSPAPLSTLAGARVTFRWEPGADEYWLAVGTAPDLSDIYASPSLGRATEHTVNGLPLNGAPVFVQLRRRQGSAVERASVQYTAAIRKGLVVITDFADRRLEDWGGAGMRSVDEVAAALQQMEDHWAWLSRGREKIRWEIIRVQLPGAAASAFGDWVAFRDAVVRLARQQARLADFDLDGDGVIDAAWLIVSNGDLALDYTVGGTSRSAGANVFVDGQASASVVSGAIGNFNHELGHCLGLPDLYGPYDTVHTLSVMSYSWDVPPPDFTAYERLKLGWLQPTLVPASRRGVWLPATTDTMAGVLIPTERATEYFLIEYRRRPATGYGSMNLAFEGLAVYHVLEGSSMWNDPPIVKLEPADGRITPGNESIDVNDFVFPENPHLLQPLALRSYFGGVEIVRISNVTRRDEGVAFDVEVFPNTASASLLVNGSFETGGSTGPVGWSAGAHRAAPQAGVWPSTTAADGGASAHLVAASANDMWWTQPASVQAGQTYQLCGLLKGEAVAGAEGDVGANLSVLGGFVRTEGLWGTFDWTRRCVSFTAETPRAEVACRLGFYGGTVTGKLWCDAMTLEPLGSAFR